MDLEAAFLQAISEQPDDDVHRLVFADWLDDHGHPARARFLREQCAARPGEEPPDDPAAVSAWREVLPPLSRMTIGWTFRRGIPEGISCGPIDATVPGAVRVVGQLVGEPAAFAVPTVREVVLDCKEVVEYDYDKHYRPLEDRGHLDADAAQVLAGLPLLDRLDRLAIRHARIPPVALETLLASPRLGRLRSLDLAGGVVPVSVARAIVDSPVAARLRVLRLPGGFFGYNRRWQPCVEGDAVAVLADAPTLAYLDVLDLAWNGLTDAEADALLRSRHLAAMLRLDVAANVIGADRVGALRRRFGTVLVRRPSPG